VHEVYDREYDCAKPTIIDGHKLFHMKGTYMGECKSCDAYVEKLELQEMKGRRP
jgi:hypothetical protein